MPVLILRRVFRKCQTCHTHEIVECFEIRNVRGNTQYPCRKHLNAMLDVSDVEMPRDSPEAK